MRGNAELQSEEDVLRYKLAAAQHLEPGAQDVVSLLDGWRPEAVTSALEERERLFATDEDVPDPNRADCVAWRNLVRRIREEADLVPDLETAGFTLQRDGREYAATCPSCGGSRRYRVWSAADGKRPGGWWRVCALYDDPTSANRNYLVPGSGFFDAVRYYALLLGLPTPDFGVPSQRRSRPGPAGGSCACTQLRTIRADTLRCGEFRDLVYDAEGASRNATLTATVTAYQVANGTETLLHSDRLILDKHAERVQFAEAAGTNPDDLLTVCERVLDWLTSEPEADESPPAGDLARPKLLFLVLCTRDPERPTNVQIGPSIRAGKSHRVNTVTAFFPPSANYEIAGASPRALVYGEESLEHRYLTISEADGMQAEGIGTSLIRGLVWGNKLRFETVDASLEGRSRAPSRRRGRPG